MPFGLPISPQVGRYLGVSHSGVAHCLKAGHNCRKIHEVIIPIQRLMKALGPASQ